METEDIRSAVREGYARVAKREVRGCCSLTSCCEAPDPAQEISRKIGYSHEDLQSVPEGANLGLGCGNPLALASLKEGETVLDLGSGAGFDCFLAANQVGKKGRVIGVDMTPEMIDKARGNARKIDYSNIEFRLGEIENLPVADNQADIVISNCVINLSPDKPRVFREAFRTLKPGGRLMVSDIVLLKPLPELIRTSIEAYVGCVGGALLKDEYMNAILAAGFQDVRVLDETSFPLELFANDPTAQAIAEDLQMTGKQAEEIVAAVVSVKICGIKPHSPSAG